MSAESADMKDMMANPEAHFDSPWDVVRDSQLAPKSKRAILEQWKLDIKLQQIAEEENMPGDTSESLQEIEKAIGAIEAEQKSGG